ncbi:Venom carboxylesterase-6 [Orchesella cincta]|uniref:Venom carboxylesterase-6 n=1 Tax=Orchesella cincta TaxID=48709 RepID=A0A1D2NKF1_ORCCI|nr:Venom carboxylesterase-6 [Orchesella cincta]
MGLKDQGISLMWIKNNIQGFGGDPARVTIMGNDVGAASAHLHMMSPMTQGLFSQAISMSGCALCPNVIQTDPVPKTKMLAEWLKCETSNNKALVECLRSKSDKEIMEAQMHFGVPGWPMTEPMLVFGPVIEQASWPSPFITDHPKNLLMAGKVTSIPWIVGFNEDEGRYHSNPIMMDKAVYTMANANWNKVAPISFLYNDNIDQATKDTVSSKIHMFYMSGKPIEPERMWNYSNIYSDRLYKSCVLDAVKMHSSMMHNNVFPYVMKFRGDFSYSDWMHHADTDPNKPSNKTRIV